MKQSIQDKLQNLIERYKELEILIAQNVMMNEGHKISELSKEYSQIKPLVTKFQEYKHTKKEILNTKQLLQDHDIEIKNMAKEDLLKQEKKLIFLLKELELLLLPKDPNDNANIFLEIRAATGGKEAAIFAGDLFRMYSKYIEYQEWKIEIISANHSEYGGFKEIIAKISGNNVYSKLKFESGTHRVQRVPNTEAQGRIHTSTCTVAIMPEVDKIQDISLSSSEIKIDTFKASGAGGQHVNKTDSAIRITHISTGLIVECQDQRSQHKNKAQAISILKAKLVQQKIDQQKKENSMHRKNLIGSGDRSERIRTYNFPQGRITDHRIDLTVYKLEEIMQGKIFYILTPLIQEYKNNLLNNEQAQNI